MTGLLFIFSLFSLLTSSILAYAWCRLAGRLVQSRPPRRRLVLCIGICALTVLVPDIYLYLVMTGAAGLAGVSSLNLDVEQMALFTLQGVVIWRMLFSRTRPALAVGAVALSYFFINSAKFTVGLIVTGQLIMPTWVRELSLEAALILNCVYALLIYLSALGIALVLGALIERTRFAHYFSGLFARPVRGRVVCGVCLLLMHSLQAIPLCFPSLMDSGGYPVLALVSGVLVLFIILAVAVFEANREKVHLQEEFIAQQQIYVQTLEALQRDMRAFRHDYQNLLSSLYLQAGQGDTEALRKTLQSTLQYVDDRLGNQIRRVTELANVQLPEVKSLLFVKLLRADALQVAVVLEIPRPVDRVDMRTEDFLRCLGILIDNALEAAVDGGPVHVALIGDGGGLTVIASNPVAAAPDLHRLGEADYTTKGQGHGTGLMSYRNLTVQYENVSTATSCEDGIFRQKLRIRRADT